MPQLTQQRRSQLLQQLMKQMDQQSQHRGTKSIGEMGLRMLGKYLTKKRADQLQEEEVADEKKLMDALAKRGLMGQAGGAVTQTPGEAILGDESEPFNVTKMERGTKPGVGMREDALARVMALPSGYREQGLQALQAVQAMQPKPKEPNYSRSRDIVPP